MKVSDLTGSALDWAVAKCVGHVDDETIIRRLEPDEEGWFIAYSNDWTQGGPIIEQEGISIASIDPYWQASMPSTVYEGEQDGPTPLVAAMRCYVASKLGDEVEVPDELVYEWGD